MDEDLLGGFWLVVVVGSFHELAAIPKLCSGSYFPDWLLERRRRAERP